MHDAPSGDSRQKLPAALARADFEMVASDYFRRLGQDNHRRLPLIPDLFQGADLCKTKGETGAFRPGTTDHCNLFRHAASVIICKRRFGPGVHLNSRGPS